MPRRAPPTPLRLISGPLPLRSRPKHTLPSLPRPTFYPRVTLSRGPKPRSREVAATEEPTLQFHMTYDLLPGIIIPDMCTRRTSSDSDSSSPVSTNSYDTGSNPSSPHSKGFTVARGPWDHSASISVPFDVTSVLAAPRPVAVNVSFIR
ncbi:hypothetical protein PHLCEN_2v4998 [Hermanssonia centrifuga]|uniref:Uncharacterized protein n=1 Tax=Hermanssonia centrifuga TaxID=98765 RepID=A0A2R6PC26_9APHY|nr:hypothetical protein PHLCEN_2v4998 [Hermanssonia centrifuga]